MNISESILSGQPMPGLIIDAHCHLTPKNAKGWYQWQPSTEVAVRNMERYGVAWTVTAPHVFGGGYQDLANRTAKEAARNYPNRIRGYVTVNPSWPMEQAKEETARYIDDPDFVGVKLLPGYQGPVGSAVNDYLLSAAQERRMPALIHTWQTYPTRQEMAEVLKKFPKLDVIVAHSGGLRDAHEEFIAMTKDYPGLYLEISGSFLCDLWLEEIVERAGADRVIFGSDFINCEQRFEIGRVGLAGISEEDKRKVMGGNFLRLVKKAKGKSIPRL